jgi:hypothetical protein
MTLTQLWTFSSPAFELCTTLTRRVKSKADKPENDLANPPVGKTWFVPLA